MEWHAGSTLSQTVYTFLYGHAIAEMHPDYLLSFEEDPSRPMELVTVVLRAAALTVMKTCSVTWAGMAKGGIHDVGELPTSRPVRILTSPIAGRLALRESRYISARRHPYRSRVRGIGPSYILVILHDTRHGHSLLIKVSQSLSLVFIVSSPGMAQCVATQGVIPQGELM